MVVVEEGMLIGRGRGRGSLSLKAPASLSVVMNE